MNNERLIHRLLGVLAIITVAGFVLATIGAGPVFGLVWVVATYLGVGLGVGIVQIIRRLT